MLSSHASPDVAVRGAPGMKPQSPGEPMPRSEHRINRDQKRPFRTSACLPLFFAALMVVPATQLAAQVCPGTNVATGLRIPLGMAQSSLGNLFAAETGTAVLHSGRISILAPDGSRRTLIDGLPS